MENNKLISFFHTKHQLIKNNNKKLVRMIIKNGVLNYKTNEKNMKFIMYMLIQL